MASLGVCRALSTGEFGHCAYRKLRQSLLNPLDLQLQTFQNYCHNVYIVLLLPFFIELKFCYIGKDFVSLSKKET